MDSTAAGNEHTEVQFAGFWRRIGAAIVDAILLGIGGWVIGIAFYERLIQYGPFARLIGLPIALLYFGLLNSRIGGGATPGKHALGIRVVTRDGAPIGISRSLWRALVYLVPLYANGLDLSVLGLPAWATGIAMAIDTFLVFGLLLATVYLYLANWRTRQVVHDLAAGTFVVRKDSLGSATTQRINPLHLVVVAILFALSLAAIPLSAAFNVQSRLGQSFGVDFKALTDIQQAVNADPDVLETGVNLNTNTEKEFGRPATVTRSLIVTAIHRGEIQAPDDFADDVAGRVLRQSPQIFGAEKLVVVIRCGFDIGIASGWRSQNYSFTPDEWRARLRHRTPRQNAA